MELIDGIKSSRDWADFRIANNFVNNWGITFCIWAWYMHAAEGIVISYQRENFFTALRISPFEAFLRRNSIRGRSVVMWAKVDRLRQGLSDE